MTSPTLPAVSFLPAAEAARVARESNEWTRKLVDSSNGRFRMFALLPMPHVDETLREIAYALDVLKADGVAFMTSYQGRYLGDKAFAPVMDELHRRKVTAYTHPDNPACCENVASGVPPVIIEYGTDTTRTIASLIFQARRSVVRTSISSSRTRAAPSQRSPTGSWFRSCPCPTTSSAASPASGC